MAPEAIPLATIEALFLDAGNTVLCWDHGFVHETARAHGFDVTRERIARLEAAARPRLDRVLARGRSTEAPDTMTAYLSCIVDAGLGAELSPPEAARFVREMAAALRTPDSSDRLWSRPPEGLAEELGALRAAGVRLVVVSNSDGTIERKLARAGILGLFDGVVDSAVVGVEKPDPAIFQHALAHGGAAPERTLHVGDLHAIDVVGARRAGLHAALLDPHDDWSHADCARYTDVPALARAIRAARRG